MASNEYSMALAREVFPEYVLDGGPFDGQRGVLTAGIGADVVLPLRRGILAALEPGPKPVARYVVTLTEGMPSRDDDGAYRYQHEGLEA